MIPIDEQIAAVNTAIQDAFLYDESDITIPRSDVDTILASLQRLKAIDAAQVPEEPVVMTKTFMRGRTMEEHEVVFKRDYDTLRDLLKREAARADEMTRKYAARWIEFNKMHERAEAAEAKLAEQAGVKK